VLPVTVPRRPAEDRDDDVRPEPADDADHVLKDRVPGPVPPGLVQRLGEAEVVGAGEVLPSAIQAPGRQQLLGAHQAQRLAQLGADEVLSAFTSVEAEIRRLGAHPPDQDGEQLGVLVVGVSADHQHSFLVAEHPELPIQPHDAAGGRRLELGPERDGDEDDEREKGRQEGERAAHGPRPKSGQAEAIPDGEAGEDGEGTSPVRARSLLVLRVL
jgi:hypothetical protein